MKYFRDANFYRAVIAVITVHNLIPRVFWLFGQLKPEDSGYEIALSTSLNSVGVGDGEFSSGMNFFS